MPTPCGAVYVELGETPELDRLRRCTRTHCPEHPAQLDWVGADPCRQVAYSEQVRRYDAGDRGGVQFEEVALL